LAFWRNIANKNTKIYSSWRTKTPNSKPWHIRTPQNLPQCTVTALHRYLSSVITVHWIQINQLINFHFSWLLHNPHCTQCTLTSHYTPSIGVTYLS